MERTLPSITCNLQSAKRYRFCRNKNNDSSQIDKTSPFANSQLRLNNRSQSSLNSNSASFAFCQVQELCLQDNKWIIFDSSRPSEVSKGPRPMTTFGKQSRQKYRYQCTGRGNNNGSSTCSYLNRKNQKERVLTVKQNSTPYFIERTDKSPQKQNKLRQPGIERINISKVTFKDNKSRVNTEQRSKENHLQIPKSKSKPKHSPSRSSLSAKSPNKSIGKGSPMKSSFKGGNSRVNPQSIKSIKSSKSLKQVQRKPKSHLLTQISQATSMTYMQHNLHVLQYLDSINLLDANYLMPPTTINPYDDFPQWGQYELPSPPILVDQSPITGSAEGQHSPKSNLEQKYDLMRKLSLPLELLENRSHHHKSIAQSSKIQEESSRKSRIEMSPNKQNNKSTKNIESAQNDVNCVSKPEESQEDKKERIVPTQPSQKPLDSADNNNNILLIPTLNIPSSHEKHTDPTFNLNLQFSSNKITLIEITKSNQTAHFPQNTKNPIFVKPNPDYNSPYQNDQLINTVNLLLKVQPTLIRQLFSNNSKHLYDVFLFEQGKRHMVSVDGMFPFDSNFYPLYGSVQQFIWFNVLVKAIAKLKGSYLKISQLKFQNVLTLLANNHPKDVSQLIAIHNQPTKLLSTMITLAKHRQTFLIITCGKQLFKLQKLVYCKTTTEQNEEYEQLLLAKATRAMGRQMKERRSINMRSLNKYLTTKKQQISLMRSINNTSLHLVGPHSTRTITFKQLLSSSYRLWMPSHLMDELQQ